MTQSFDFRSWLFGLSPRGVKLGLSRMKELLRRLGDPQKQFSAIHIGGTNGKGSTAAFCSSLLLAAGRYGLQQKQKPEGIGLYTSPHLLRLTERIQYSDSEFGRLLECSEIELRGALYLIREKSMDMELTFFEAMTAAAFYLFAKRNLKLAVIEVGLGGRLDATKLCDPVCSIITSISYDHTEILGSTLEQIAYEKAGIFKPGVPAFAACDDFVARQVLVRQANALGCPLSVYHDTPSVDPLPEFLKTQISLPGKHQLRNAALALAAVQQVPLPWRTWLKEEEVQIEGLSKAYWPGRLERIRNEAGQEIWVDAAHNPEGARALSDWMRELSQERPVTILFGVVQEKAVAEMIEPLFHAHTVILSRPVSQRGRDPSQIFPAIREALPGSIEVVQQPDLEKALALALEKTPPNGFILAYGSIFLIGHIRRILLHEPSDPVVLQDPKVGSQLAP